MTRIDGHLDRIRALHAAEITLNRDIRKVGRPRLWQRARRRELRQLEGERAQVRQRQFETWRDLYTNGPTSGIRTHAGHMLNLYDI